MKNKNKGIDILSLEAKDIYIANEYYDKENGVNIRYQSGDFKGEINTRKFLNTLDYSLELIKLREVYERKYRNKRFSFEKNGHEYCTRVINVTFKYSLKTYNKVRKNMYVKLGENIKNIKLEDCVYIKDGVLIAIETEKEVISPIKNEILGKYFYFHDGKYHAKNNIPTEMSTSELREYVYKRGFLCDGIKFVRFKRSSGSARVGKCLFIDEKLYPMMHKWELCGLKIKNGQSIDLAAFESYISLTLSSIIDTIQIKPDNILLVDDYESVFEDDVMETSILNSSLITKPCRISIANSIWDGQSLMDKSIFGEYEDKGMLLLRNRFFKSCCFNCNIQQWFKDNNITDISQLNGKTRAKRIEDIKLITTPSSIKYLKFGTYDEWLDNLESLFGVVKYEKPTHFIDGEMVQTHYQLLNSLQMSEKEVDDFLKPVFDYIDLIKNEPAVLRNHIKYSYQDFGNEPLKSNNDIVYKMMGISNDFAETKLYHNFKQDLVKSMINDIRVGRVMVKGNYSVLAGNVIEMLQQSIGTFYGESILGIGNISSSKFDYNQYILGSRSPHITISNVWLPYNINNELIEKYMNRTNEIVYINSIGENVLQKLSGSDFDSDTVLLSDNPILCQCAKKNYNNFLVSTNNVESLKRKREYTNEQQCDLDIKTQGNIIGEDINLSQDLNSILWDNLNNGSSISQLQTIYADICTLNVISNLAIDSAKKEFIVDIKREMAKIQQKYKTKDESGRTIKPYFFGYIAKKKGFYDKTRTNYKQYKTTMDFLEKSVNRYQRTRSKSKRNEFKKFSDILDTSNFDYNNVYYNQIQRVLNLVNDTLHNCNSICSSTTYTNEEKWKLYHECKQRCIDYIGNLEFTKDTMISILRKIDADENKKISNMLFKILFGYPNTSFFEVLKESVSEIEVLELDNLHGNIPIFHLKYQKTYKN